ncbi:MAG: hypothetical protein K9L89_01770, partial [Kiritimatiellales bacterium]|nr:hypothetical protein [Kiritimatiellales bacterium]
IFGWNIHLIMAVVGISVTVYSLVGGVVAVIWTDAIQALVLMGGAVVVLVVMLLKMPGGAGHVFEVAANHGKFSLGSFTPDMAEKTFWTLLLFGLAENLRNFGIDQSYIQRYIASKSDKEAKQGLWLAGLLYVPISAVFFFIGTSLFAFFHADTVVDIETRQTAALVAQGMPEADAHRQAADLVVADGIWDSPGLRDLNEVRHVVARQQLLQAGRNESDPGFAVEQEAVARSKGLGDLGDRVFPYFISTYLPPGLTGLLIAAVFAAGMSTISTSLNSSATLTLTDYYKRLVNPNASGKQEMAVLYSATISWGLLGTGLAFLLVQVTESALDMWWMLSGIFSGGMVGLFLLGLISRKTRNPAAMASVLIGLLVILWMSLPKVADMLMNARPDSALHRCGATLQNLCSGGLASHFHALLIPVIGTLVILVVGISLTGLLNLRKKL